LAARPLRRAVGCRSVRIPDGRPAAAEIFLEDLPDAADLRASAVHLDVLVPAPPRGAFLAGLPVDSEMAVPAEQGIVALMRAVLLQDEARPVLRAVRRPGSLLQAAVRAAHPQAAEVLPQELLPVAAVLSDGSDVFLPAPQRAVPMQAVARPALPPDAAELQAEDRLRPAQQVALALARRRELPGVQASPVLRASEALYAEQQPELTPQSAQPVSLRALEPLPAPDAVQSWPSLRRSSPLQRPLPPPRARGNASAPTPRARCQSSSSASFFPPRRSSAKSRSAPWP